MPIDQNLLSHELFKIKNFLERHERVNFIGSFEYVPDHLQ